MRKDITVTAEPRDSRGKNEARRLRANGSMPAVVYGGPSGATPVAVDPKQVARILNSKTGHNTIFNLGVNGDSTPVMVVDWQYDPIKDSLLHVDLKRIDLTQRITVRVPIIAQGDPKGVKLQGGIQDVVTREIEIECLPDEIPEQFVVNVSELMIGQSVRAADIPLEGSIKLLTLPDTVITHVISIKAEEETVAETGGPAAAPAGEPEVIKKGKKDEEAADTPAKKK